MNLKDRFQNAFNAFKTAHPEAVVSVTISGKSGSGTKGVAVDGASLADAGEVGLSSGTVRVSTADFSKPGKGAAITVGSDACLVVNVRTDQVGAFYLIDYQLQKTVTGTGDIV